MTRNELNAAIYRAVAAAVKAGADAGPLRVGAAAPAEATLRTRMIMIWVDAHVDAEQRRAALAGALPPVAPPAPPPPPPAGWADGSNVR